MNILWITNNVLPELAKACNFETSASGSWLINWSQNISIQTEINLAVATVYGDKYRKLKVNNITYYLLPGSGKNMMFYTKKYEMIWRKIAEDFHVDIVHLHGTEYSHGLSFLRSNPDIKSVVSVQGVISRIADNYFDGLPKGFPLKYTTLSELIKINGTYAKALLYRYNSKYEREVFERVQYANVVNFWDQSLAQEFNHKIKCFQLEYNLREAFYSAPKWELDKIIPHRIFTNPGGDPIKGLHILCKAIAIVKRYYPDVSLVVPGKNINAAPISGYDKYIHYLIHQLGIEENISFAGRLNENEMMSNMRKSHAVVIPSSLEGTSLILREAMYIGVPCFATFRGGMADFIRDKESGFLYDFNEYSYLAHRIIELFENNTLAQTISKNAISQAEKAHNREKNIKELLNMYRVIYSEG